MDDRPRVELTPLMAEEQERVAVWANLAAFVWSELRAYDEIPEGVRGELLIAWLGAWLGGE